MARTILFLFTLAAAQVCAHAAAPNLFTYQGRLKEGGMPVTGNREVEIWLCPAESGGPACTTTGPQPVAVANGLFRSTFSLPGGFDLGSGAWWLEIEIGGATLSPRERLTSNAYAMYAATAAYAEGLTAAPGSAGVYISSNLYVAGGAFTVGSRLQVSTHGTTAVGDFSGISVDTNTAMHVVGRTADLQPGIEDGRVAFYADARSSGSGPEDILAASNNEVTSDGADSAALAVAVRAKIRRENAGAGIIGQVYGLMVDDLSNSGGTLTNTYGVYIGDQTDGVQTNGAYALYSSDINARNYFGGFVGISSAAPVAALSISSAAGSADRMLVISTGTSEIFSVKGNGEVYTAGKFIGDGSLLINLPASGGSVSKAGDTMNGQLTVASTVTVYGASSGYGLLVSSGVSLGGVIYTGNRNLGVGISDPGEMLTLPYNGFAGWQYSTSNHNVAHKIGKTSDGAGPLQFVTTFNPGETGEVFRFSSSYRANLLSILADGGVGLSTGQPGAAMDIVSTGTASNVYAQIWRNGNGVVVASMTSQGALYVTSLGSGDNLGSHTASASLNMAGNNIDSAAQLTVSTVTGPLNSYVYFNQNLAVPSSRLVVGRGAATAGYPLSVYGDSGGIAPVLHLENKTNGSGSGIGVLFSASGAGWGSLNVVDESASIGSTSMRFATFSGEVLRLHGARAGIGSTTPDQKLTVAGNISQTGVLISSGAGSSYFAGSIGINTTNPNYRLDVQGGYVNASGGLCIGDNCKSSWASIDNLGDHTATTNLQMSQKSVLQVASVTMAGSGLQIATDLTSTGNGIFISTAGSIWTLGFGNGSAAPNGRGVGAVDLQTFRSLATQVSGGKYSVIAGGNNNTAGGEGSVVAGGGTNNATGTYPTVGGGQANTANSTYATVSGGGANAATGYAATVSGGQGNIAKGNYSSVSGYGGSAMANYATIAGGRNNSATGEASWAAGYMSSSTASGAFTWADGEGVATQNAVQDRTLFKNRGGFLVTGSTNTNMTASVNRGVFVSGDGLLGVSTGAPKAALDVVAKAGNDSVQIWRDSGGVAVATMTADGTLQARSPIKAIYGPVSNSVLVEETLLSYNLPANTLNSNGKGVRISVWGKTAANGNAKTIRLKFGVTTLVFNTVTPSPNALNWHYEAKVYRTGASAQKYVGSGYVGAAPEAVSLGASLESDTAAISITLTGLAPSAAGDITAEGMTIELIN